MKENLSRRSFQEKTITFEGAQLPQMRGRDILPIEDGLLEKNKRGQNLWWTLNLPHSNKLYNNHQTL